MGQPTATPDLPAIPNWIAKGMAFLHARIVLDLPRRKALAWAEQHWHEMTYSETDPTVVMLREVHGEEMRRRAGDRERRSKGGE